jgi:hypothetical protein
MLWSFDDKDEEEDEDKDEEEDEDKAEDDDDVYYRGADNKEKTADCKNKDQLGPRKVCLPPNRIVTSLPVQVSSAPTPSSNQSAIRTLVNALKEKNLRGVLATKPKQTRRDNDVIWNVPQPSAQNDIEDNKRIEAELENVESLEVTDTDESLYVVCDKSGEKVFRPVSPGREKKEKEPAKRLFLAERHLRLFAQRGISKEMHSRLSKEMKNVERHVRRKRKREEEEPPLFQFKKK